MSEIAFKNLVRAMLVDDAPGSGSAKALRNQFYTEPEVVMDTLGPGAQADRLRARLYTMRRTIIARVAQEWDLVEGYQMEHEWPDQGPDDWPDDNHDGWTDVPPLDDTCLNVKHDWPAESAQLMRGGWGDPGPHGRGFKEAEFAVDTPITLRLVGEGYLSTAQIELESLAHPSYQVGPVALDQIFIGNFQRVYLKTKPFELSRDGDYRVFVRNHKCYTRPEDRIPAGQLLRIT